MTAVPDVLDSARKGEEPEQWALVTGSTMPVEELGATESTSDDELRESIAVHVHAPSVLTGAA
ncbi:MAG: hypothetical protein ACRDXB_13765 [Actinomycetes bacterium]